MVRSVDAMVLAAVREAVFSVDPNFPVYDTRSMADLRSENIAQDRLGAIVAGVFAALGLLLAAFGLFGVLSYVVNSRTREIGTRIALGAERSDVVSMVLRQALGLSTLGTAIGLVAAVGLGNLLESLVIGTRAASPTLLAVVSLTLVIATVLAAAGPAIRAARIDPLAALKE